MQAIYIGLIAFAYAAKLQTLILLASFIAYLVIMIKASKLKKRHENQKEERQDLYNKRKNQAWNMIDFTLLGFATLSLYFDCYYLESWRIEDIENRMYATFDKELILYAPNITFFMSLTIVSKENLRAIMKNVGVPFLSLFFMIYFTCSYKFLYRSRLILGICMVIVSTLFYMGACLIINQKRIQKLEQERKNKRQLRIQTMQDKARIKIKQFEEDDIQKKLLELKQQQEFQEDTSGTTDQLYDKQKGIQGSKDQQNIQQNGSGKKNQKKNNKKNK
eukprot:403344824